MDHVLPDAFGMSSSKLLVCYFAFSGVAAGLVYLQRSNTLLKHNFLAFSATMAFVTVFEGTELMLKILPWAIMGMLLVSGLFHAFAKCIQASVNHHGQ